MKNLWQNMRQEDYIGHDIQNSSQFISDFEKQFKCKNFLSTIHYGITLQQYIQNMWVFCVVLSQVICIVYCKCGWDYKKVSFWHIFEYPHILYILLPTPKKKNLKLPTIPEQNLVIKFCSENERNFWLFFRLCCCDSLI